MPDDSSSSSSSSYEREVPICDPCSCEDNSDGEADNDPSKPLPGSPNALCQGKTSPAEQGNSESPAAFMSMTRARNMQSTHTGDGETTDMPLSIGMRSESTWDWHTLLQDSLTTTLTTPAGTTFITTRNTDGSIAHESGSGQRELWHLYDIQNYRLRETVKLGDSKTTLRQTLINGLGQENTRTMASTTGYFYTRNEYNAKGQLIKQYQDTGSRTTPTLYEYDAFGNVTRQVLALGNAPTVHNSPIIETAYTVESTPEGVYRVTTRTRYNAEREPLSTIQKQLISQSCPHLEQKLLTTNERGLTSGQGTTYNEETKRATYSTVPTSDTTAEAVAVDGVTISQTDNAGVTTTATRYYSIAGVTLTQTDGRGNTSATVMDKAGRTISQTDAADHTTTTVYDAAHDQPSVITDAMGNTSCFRYDERGRKTAEWGTAIQPACFSYDEANRMTSLTTFRAGTETVSTDPSERTDGDTTTWCYHDASSLETRKTYADGSHVDKAYDDFNRLSVGTLARGITRTNNYEHARGLLLGTAYSDGTTARSYTYNHLGQLTQVTDDAATRTIGYNAYGERETDSLAAGGVTHLITENLDEYGRSTGYTYAKNGTVQHTVTTGYGADGRIATAGFMHGGREKQFSYGYLPGNNLLQTLTMPCNMTLTQSYETQRDLLIGMAYHRSTTLVAQRTYSYDTLGRPLTRSTARNGQTVNDSFVYSSRSELASAAVNGSNYGYDYDNIGNRRMVMEARDYTLYEANELNQYTSIQENEDAAFAPTFDADGNQTLVKTATGIWTVQYDAENRPIRFTSADGSIVIECAYDTHGRRVTKKVTTNGSIIHHQRYIYRGYLQIACCDLTRSNHPCLWLITWDPSQPVATRPLAIQKDGTWYTYGWDLTKNICEIYGQHGYIRTFYTYTPYGQVASTGDVEQPIQWSSEYNDSELGLIYYNYRHYNPVDGRWMGRDSDQERKDLNDYLFAKNSPSYFTDVEGLWVIPVIIFIAGAVAGTYAGLFIENECHVVGKISKEEVRQKCTRTCKYPSMWACCKNTEKSRIRKAKYICE